jgi:hypothetical protein
MTSRLTTEPVTLLFEHHFQTLHVDRLQTEIMKTGAFYRGPRYGIAVARESNESHLTAQRLGSNAPNQFAAINVG